VRLPSGSVAVGPLAVTLRDTLRNLECLRTTSGQLDTLLGQLMEPMTRWTITSVIEEVGGTEDSEEESTSSESEEVVGRCE